MRIGPYLVLETIGAGAMGIVYRAQHEESGQRVAIKVMTAEAASNSLLRQRFEQEVSAANRLRHPHIVQGLAFGREDDRLYLVMELVEGVTLGEWIRERGPLVENEAVRIALEIADALHTAHQHKLIHRDVKPDNILLTAEGQAKLTDLGLVKDLTANMELTWDRMGLGTIAYMAPEQFENARNADARSDVYALAATLYHTLTGSAPFQGQTTLVVVKKKLLNDFVPPHRLVLSLSRHIDETICRALDNDPEKRPSSCEEFAACLRGERARPTVESDRLATSEAEEADLSVEEEANRRRAFRFPSISQVVCFPMHDTQRRWRGEIRDVSVGGIQLELSRRFEPGSLLAVDVLDKPAESLSSLYVKVRWVRKIAAEKWFLGCAFVRDLSNTDLNGLLGNPAATVVVLNREGAGKK